VPPGILAVELATVCLHIAAELDSRLAVDYGNVLQTGIFNGKQRSLAAEYLIFD
jgi:hypothetical protein